MRLILLLLAILMLSTTATAHEVKPPPRKEACDAAKWMKNTDRITFVGPDRLAHLNEVYRVYEAAQDECKAYQEREIDRQVEWRVNEICVSGDVTLAVTKCD